METPLEVGMKRSTSASETPLSSAAEASVSLAKKKLQQYISLCSVKRLTRGCGDNPKGYSFSGPSQTTDGGPSRVSLSTLPAPCSTGQQQPASMVTLCHRPLLPESTPQLTEFYSSRSEACRSSPDWGWKPLSTA